MTTPPEFRPRRKRIWLWGSALIVATALAVIYFTIDPASALWMPKCPVKMLTGYDCPGCGSQRMIHALLHGDLEGAMHANALLLFMIPYLIIFAVADSFPRHFPKTHRLLTSGTAITAVCLIIIAWIVLRNSISEFQ